MRRTDACRFRFRDSHIYKDPLLKMIRIGLPAGVQGCLFSISNVIIQSSVNSFGSAAFIAGNGAAANIEGFVYNSMNAFNQTAVNYIGQNLGAGQYDRIKKIFWRCLGCVTVLGVVMGWAALFFAPRLLLFYIPDSPEAVSYGILRMTWTCLPYFACGLMDVATGALRGLGKSFFPMVVTVLGVCGFRITWVYTVFAMPRYHTPSCLYSSYVISWVLTFTVQFFLFWYSYRQLRRQAS